jgi:hypothetical protein
MCNFISTCNRDSLVAPREEPACDVNSGVIVLYEAMTVTPEYDYAVLPLIASLVAFALFRFRSSKSQ